jgi:hypothetical protein
LYAIYVRQHLQHVELFGSAARAEYLDRAGREQHVARTEIPRDADLLAGVARQVDGVRSSERDLATTTRLDRNAVEHARGHGGRNRRPGSHDIR